MARKFYWINWDDDRRSLGGNLAVGHYFDTRSAAKAYIPSAKRMFKALGGNLPATAKIKIKRW